MKVCPTCEGELLRHGVSKRKDGTQYGTRYRCRDCGITFTVRDESAFGSDKRLQFNPTGRPTVKDWRFLK